MTYTLDNFYKVINSDYKRSNTRYNDNYQKIYFGLCEF